MIKTKPWSRNKASKISLFKIIVIWPINEANKNPGSESGAIQKIYNCIIKYDFIECDLESSSQYINGVSSNSEPKKKRNKQL